MSVNLPTTSPSEMPSERRRALPPVRRLDHDDPRDQQRLLQLLDEYLRSVGTDDAAARYRWLYRDNPCGAALTFLAEDEGRPVAMTSLFPRRVLLDRRVHTGAVGGDGYVTPAWRRRGLATELHRAALRAMEDGEVSFMFGPPEPANLRALVRAGAVVTGGVQRFLRPLRLRGWPGHPVATRLPTGALLGLVDRLLSPGASRLRAEALGAAPDPRVDELWARVARAQRGRAVPVRDGAFYAWRFGRSPAGVQRPYLLLDGDTPVAALALERAGERAAIVDLTALSGRLRAALGAVLDLCRDARSVEVQIHVPSPRRAALLGSLGFLPRAAKPFQVQAPAGHPARDPLDWLYAWGDGDVDHVLE